MCCWILNSRHRTASNKENYFLPWISIARYSIITHITFSVTEGEVFCLGLWDEFSGLRSADTLGWTEVMFVGQTDCFVLLWASGCKITAQKLWTDSKLWTNYNDIFKKYCIISQRNDNSILVIFQVSQGLWPLIIQASVPRGFDHKASTCYYCLYTDLGRGLCSDCFSSSSCKKN